MVKAPPDPRAWCASPNIRKQFGGVCALNGASLELRGGEILALLGESGARKSTLMRILAGLERAGKRSGP